MKKKGILVTLGVLFILYITFFIRYDNKRNEYGWGCIVCNDKIPYNIKPKFIAEYPRNFVLMDSDDFELVGSGFRYQKTNFKINKFLVYGYNDSSILIKCTDSLNNIKYLISYETGYKNDLGNPEISFEDITKEGLEKNKEDFNWVELNEKEARSNTLKSFFFLCSAILSFLILLWLLFKKRKS